MVGEKKRLGGRYKEFIQGSERAASRETREISGEDRTVKIFLKFHVCGKEVGVVTKERYFLLIQS